MIKKIFIILFLFISFWISNIFADDSEQWIIYSNWSDWSKLYKKNIDDTNNWFSINSINSSHNTYSTDWKHIFYINWYEWWVIFKKNSSDKNNGEAISNWRFLDYSPISKSIIYTKWFKLYSFDIEKGIEKFLLEWVADPVYSPDWKSIIYRNESPWWYYWTIYKKPANDWSKGYNITNINWRHPEYSPDWKWIIYISNWRIYKKVANDLSDWDIIISASSSHPKYSPDWKWIIYSNLSDWGKLYKRPAADVNINNWFPITSVSSLYPSFSPIKIPNYCPTDLNQDGSCSVASSSTSNVFINLTKTHDNNDLTCTQFTSNQTSKYKDTSKWESMNAASADPVNLATW